MIKNLILNYKFLITTIIIFSITSIWTSLYLSMFSGGEIIFDISKKFLYTFNMEDSVDISINAVRIILVYIFLFYFLLNFISKYLDEKKYIYIMRMKSISKYIKNLVIGSYIMILIYFFVGYTIVFFINWYLNGKIEFNIRDTILVLKVFVDSILQVFFIINIMILIICYKKDFKFAIACGLGSFIFGVIGVFKIFPGYYIYSYRIIEMSNGDEIIFYVSYIVGIILSWISIQKIIIKNKDVLVCEYET